MWTPQQYDRYQFPLYPHQSIMTHMWCDFAGLGTNIWIWCMKSGVSLKYLIYSTSRLSRCSPAWLCSNLLACSPTCPPWHLNVAGPELHLLHPQSLLRWLQSPDSKDHLCAYGFQTHYTSSLDLPPKPYSWNSTRHNLTCLNKIPALPSRASPPQSPPPQ